MKKIVLLFCVAGFGLTAFCQTNKISDHARELLEITGSGKLGVQIMNTMLATFKQQAPNVPSEFWDEFSKEINAKDLVDLLVPIYTKYYTDEEMVKLIAFYKTPLGQKVIEKLPLISQDSYKAGEAWGRKLGEKVVSRLKEKGYIQDN